MQILTRTLHWFAWAAAIYVLIGLLLYFMQRSILYYPTPQVAHRFEVMQINSGSHELSVIVVNPGQTAALLYFGGNAEAVAMSAARLAETLPRHTIYLLEYPGYGNSSGQPSAESIVSAALSLHDQIAADHEQIDVLGRSLGSGVAMEVAQQRPVHKVVLVTPYDSIVGLAKDRYPIFPVSWLLKDHWDSGALANGVSSPVLVIAAEQDQVIPPWSTELLVSRFPSKQTTTQWIKGAGHNNLANEQYYQLLHEFLSQRGLWKGGQFTY